MRYESMSPMPAGKEFELDLIGRPGLKPDTTGEIKQCLYSPDCKKGTGELINDLEKHYNGDPTNPEKAFLRDLRIEIIDLLGLSTDEEMSRVGIYPTIDTALDLRGIDFFIKFMPENKKTPIRVFGDVTLASPLEKQERYEGNMPDKIFVYGDAEEACINPESEECMKMISRYAGQFVSTIKKKTSLKKAAQKLF